MDTNNTLLLPTTLINGLLVARRQVAAIDYAEEAHRAARYALECLPSFDDVVDWRDEPFSALSGLLDRLRSWDANPMYLRRELAARVLDNDGCPL